MITHGTGILIFKKALNEKGFLLKILTTDDGLISGYAYNSKKYFGLMQLGNFVAFEKKQKTKEQLGTLSLELLNSFSINLIGNKEKLYSFNYLCELLLQILHEEEKCPSIVDHLKTFLTEPNHKKNLLVILKEILTISGYSLSLKACTVTNETSNLLYISPKTGCAVGKEAGEAYKDKLFKFPQALKNIDNTELTASDYEEAKNILIFFINKFIFENRNKNMPKLMHG